MSINRRMDKQMWYVHTAGYCSAIKGRMTLTSIMRSERSQAPKATIVGFYSYDMSRVGKTGHGLGNWE